MAQKQPAQTVELNPNKPEDALDILRHIAGAFQADFETHKRIQEALAAIEGVIQRTPEIKD